MEERFSSRLSGDDSAFLSAAFAAERWHYARKGGMRCPTRVDDLTCLLSRSCRRAARFGISEGIISFFLVRRDAPPFRNYVRLHKKWGNHMTARKISRGDDSRSIDSWWPRLFIRRSEGWRDEWGKRVLARLAVSKGAPDDLDFVGDVKIRK